MIQETKTVKLTISIEVKTNKNIDEVKRAVVRGIYRGLDSAPNYIASPNNVNIKCSQEL